MVMKKIGEDWEVTADGFYVATRDFLSRRGYCCANKCRNCPYVNWRLQPEWQPVDSKFVKHTRVTPKALAGARALLAYYEEQRTDCPQEDRDQLEEYITHYQLLIEHWG
jgi:hypothetical protein